MLDWLLGPSVSVIESSTSLETLDRMTSGWTDTVTVAWKGKGLYKRKKRCHSMTWIKASNNRDPNYDYIEFNENPTIIRKYRW